MCDAPVILQRVSGMDAAIGGKMTTDQANEEKKTLIHFPFTLNQSVGEKCVCVCVSFFGRPQRQVSPKPLPAQ